MGRKVRRIEFFRIDLRGQRIVLLGQRRNQVVRISLAALQQIFLCVQRRPLLHQMNDAQLFNRRCRKFLLRCRARFVRFFMFLLHLLDAVVQIPAGIGQVALRVLHIIAGNIQAGLGQI